LILARLLGASFGRQAGYPANPGNGPVQYIGSPKMLFVSGMSMPSDTDASRLLWNVPSMRR
jgi:hypothetical protein